MSASYFLVLKCQDTQELSLETTVLSADASHRDGTVSAHVQNWWVYGDGK